MSFVMNEYRYKVNFIYLITFLLLIISAWNLVGAEKTLYHTVTNPDIAQSVLNGIDPDFFGASSRFGKGFYLSEVPDTTLAELTHHIGVGVDTIRYDFDAKKAKI